MTNKENKLAILLTQLADQSGQDVSDVAKSFSEGKIARRTFDLLFEQIEGLQESNRRFAEQSAIDQQAASVAEFKAQQYFVRLRDGKLLNPGEKF